MSIALDTAKSLSITQDDIARLTHTVQEALTAAEKRVQETDAILSRNSSEILNYALLNHYSVAEDVVDLLNSLLSTQLRTSKTKLESGEELITALQTAGVSKENAISLADRITNFRQKGFALKERLLNLLDVSRRINTRVVGTAVASQPNKVMELDSSAKRNKSISSAFSVLSKEDCFFPDGCYFILHPDVTNIHDLASVVFVEIPEEEAGIYYSSHYLISNLESNGDSLGFKNLGVKLLQAVIETSLNKGDFQGRISLKTELNSAGYYFDKFNMRVLPTKKCSPEQAETLNQKIAEALTNYANNKFLLESTNISDTGKEEIRKLMVGGQADTRFAGGCKMYLPVDNTVLMEKVKKMLFNEPVLTETVARTIKEKTPLSDQTAEIIWNYLW